MTTYSKLVLSGSTDGKPIAITGTTSGGAQTIHTAPASGLDEVFLLACNNDTVARVLTLLIGGTAAANQIKISLNPQEGLVIILPGLPAQNSIAITAFADTTAVINITGHAIRAA